jgi:hypothetical protein
VEQKEYNKLINVFVDAFLFEPSNTVLIDKDTNHLPEFTYIHYPPTSTLHPYIGDFESRDNNNETTTVIDCSVLAHHPDIEQCCGNGGSHHAFMNAEGRCFCSLCHTITCLQCTFRKNDSTINMCYECYLPGLSLERDNMDNDLSLDDLRDGLREMGLETTAGEAFNDLVIDMYDAYKTREMYNQLVTSKVPVPCENTDYFQVLLQNNKVTSFDFANGGDFIVDSRLSFNQVAKLIKIIAGLVTIVKPNEEEPKQYTDRAYRLVPRMIVDFAEQARINTGFRLVHRCMRHGIDPQTYSILFSKCHIVTYNNEPCILVHHRMEASMRQISYKVMVCFNKEDIVACSCECKVVDGRNTNTLCTHSSCTLSDYIVMFRWNV